MPATKIADHVDFRVDTQKLSNQLRDLVEAHTKLLDRLLYRYIALYVALIITCLALLVLLAISIAGIVSTHFAAIAIGALALTNCAAFITHRYLTLHKPIRLGILAAAFTSSCREMIPLHEEIGDHHLFLASAHTLFAEHLKGRASTYFYHSYLPQRLHIFCSSLSEVCHQYPVEVLRELLLKEALSQHLDLVKRNPLNLTYHSRLANTYVLLSHLFPKQQIHKSGHERFRYYAQRAVTEFQIIASYAPTDPWIHTQLAMSYRDLGLPQEEVRTCEAILKLCPTDSDTLLRLGILYFQLGDHAKGLGVYEELRHLHWQLAEQLIVHYGDERYAH
jgi:tetratricopeptide (TPR) repeat protein